jgi:putative phosphoesterase
VRLAIISDTHLPRGQRRIPDACLKRLHEADLIVHGGDLSTLAVLHELERLGPPVVAVHGNVDDGAVRARLPERRTIDAGGVQLGLIHDAGPAQRRLERMRGLFPDAAAVIFGHSHIPLHEQAPDGFQIFNPGSPTERRREPRHTMGTAEAGDGLIVFRLIPLD